MTPAEIKAKFIERDKEAVDDMRNSWIAPTESSRLAFLEGRVQDLCGVVIFLLDQTEKQRLKQAADHTE